jgi:hypothetical protein
VTRTLYKPAEPLCRNNINNNNNNNDRCRHSDRSRYWSRINCVQWPCSYRHQARPVSYHCILRDLGDEDWNSDMIRHVDLLNFPTFRRSVVCTSTGLGSPRRGWCSYRGDREEWHMMSYGLADTDFRFERTHFINFHVSRLWEWISSSQKIEVDCSSETSASVCELQFTSPKMVILMTFSWFFVYLGGARVPETYTVCHPCDVMVDVSALKLPE